MLPSVCYDENRDKSGGRVIVNVTYAPGEGVLVQKNSLLYGNKWRNARPEFMDGVTDNEVRQWLDHVEELVPNEAERNHLLDVLAYKVQHPEKKINHAILLSGRPGVGKDTMLAPFLYAIGGQHHDNVALSDAKTMESVFNYDLENEVIIINELRPEEFKDRRALENTLKPIIAAPPEFLTINRKGAHPYQAVNRALVIAYSNYRDAIALPSDDRRWFVLWAEGERKDCADLWRWYKRDGLALVAGWLATRPVYNFDPGMIPPMTDAKAILITQTRSSAEEFLIDHIENGRGDFAAGVVAGPWYGLIDRLQGLAPDRLKITQSALLHALVEAGWVDKGRVMSHKHTTKKRIFCKPDMRAYSNSDLREMVEANPPADQIAAAAISKAAAPAA